MTYLNLQAQIKHVNQTATSLLSVIFVINCVVLGTTWVQHIANLIKNQGEDDDKELMESVPWPDMAFIPMKMFNQMPSPRIFKSHSPYDMMAGGLPQTSPAKYIYIVRNPKDTAVSFYYQVWGFVPFQYSQPWEHFFRLFMNGTVQFGLWFDHVLEWWKHRDAENILFLKYEDMKKDHRGAVKRIAEFMGYDLKEEVIDVIVEKSTFQSMKDSKGLTMISDDGKLRRPDAPRFFRKGIVGDWRSHFTLEQNAEFDAVYAEKMKGSGMDFDDLI